MIRLAVDAQLAGGYALAAFAVLLLLLAGVIIAWAALDGYSRRRREQSFEGFLVEVERTYRSAADERTPPEQEVEQEADAPELSHQRSAVLSALLLQPPPGG